MSRYLRCSLNNRNRERIVRPEKLRDWKLKKSSFSVSELIVLTDFSTQSIKRTNPSKQLVTGPSKQLVNITSAQNSQRIEDLPSSQSTTWTRPLPGQPLGNGNSLTNSNFISENKKNAAYHLENITNRNRGEKSEQIVKQIVLMTGLSSSNVIQLLKRTLISTEKNLTCLLEHLKVRGCSYMFGSLFSGWVNYQREATFSCHCQLWSSLVVNNITTPV